MNANDNLEKQIEAIRQQFLLLPLAVRQKLFLDKEGFLAEEAEVLVCGSRACKLFGECANPTYFQAVAQLMIRLFNTCCPIPNNRHNPYQNTLTYDFVRKGFRLFKSLKKSNCSGSAYKRHGRHCFVITLYGSDEVEQMFHNLNRTVTKNEYFQSILDEAEMLQIENTCWNDAPRTLLEHAFGDSNISDIHEQFFVSFFHAISMVPEEKQKGKGN